MIDFLAPIDVPAGRYAAIHHRGPDVQASYRQVFDWADQQGMSVSPYEAAFHHIERYPEPLARRGPAITDRATQE